MKTKSLAVIAAFAFALIFAAIGRTEEKSKDKEKAPASMEPTYSVTCPGPCDFKVSGHDRAEVATVVKEHAKTHHHMDMSDKDLDGMMKVKEAKK